jgi:transposase-like protein
MCKDLVMIAKTIQVDSDRSQNHETVASCPSCGGVRFVKNGTTRSGRQNYRCKACGAQSELNPEKLPPSFETMAIIKKLLWHQVKVSTISSATGVPRKKIYALRAKMNAQEAR